MKITNESVNNSEAIIRGWVNPMGATSGGGVSDGSTTTSPVNTIIFAGPELTVTDNGDGTVTVTDTDSGGSMWFNVMDYGAVGDGTTDDTTAIAAAITAAAGGGIVYFPPGTYLMSSTLTVTVDGVTLQGDGPGASIILAAPGLATGNMVEFDGDDCRMIGLQLTSASIKSGGNGLLLNGANRFTGSQLRIDHQYNSIKLLSSFVIRLVDLDLRDQAHHGIWIDGATGNDFYLSRIVADNATNATGHGIFISGGDALIASNCDFLNFAHGLLIQPTVGRHSEWHFLTGMIFDQHTNDGMHIGDAAGNIYGVTLVNCWGSSNGEQGLYIGGSSGAIDGVDVIGGKFVTNGRHGMQVVSPAVRVTLADNLIVGNSTSSSTTYDGINIAAGVLHLGITGNQSYNGMGFASTQGYGLNFASGATDYLVLSDNDFAGNATGTIGNLAGVSGTHKFIGGSASMTGAAATTYLDGSGAYSTPAGGSGTVTSVALTVPAEFAISGSPITSSGTLAITKATETANTVWAGPTSGSAAQPAFRSLVAADIPAGVGQTDHQHINNLQYNGDGSTTAFELPAAPFDEQSVVASIAGVIQDVTLSGTMLTTMTFLSAPASGTNNVRVDIVAVAA